MSSPEPPSPPSDSGGIPPTPPPPSYGAAPPPPPPAQGAGPSTPPSYGAAPPAPPYGHAPPAYGGHPGLGTDKPPRPDVKVGAILTLAGGLLGLLGTFLPWITSNGQSGNGYEQYFIRDGLDVVELDNPGYAVVFFSVVLTGLGITLFLAGRVLAVAIIAIVCASIAALVGLVMIGFMATLSDDIGGSVGFGVILVLLAALVSLAGAIVATSKRRRWPA